MGVRRLIDVLKASWVALKDVAFMYVASGIYSLIVMLSTGGNALIHPGWAFLALSAFLQASWEIAIVFKRDNRKDKVNRKFGVVISTVGLIVSSLVLHSMVSSPDKPSPATVLLLWPLVFSATLLRYFSRNVTLQREAGRYA